MFQPQVHLRLPCYDFTSVTIPYLRLYPSFWHGWSPWCDGRCVQDLRTYSPWHADPRLLAIPTSCTRVAEYNPDWDGLWRFARSHNVAALCNHHCSTCVAQPIRAMMTCCGPHLPLTYVSSSHRGISSLIV